MTRVKQTFIFHIFYFTINEYGVLAIVEKKRAYGPHKSWVPFQGSASFLDSNANSRRPILVKKEKKNQ